MTWAKRFYFLLLAMVVIFDSQNSVFHSTISPFRRTGDDQDLAEFLIEKGARLNYSNEYGETPLHYAARSGEFTAFQFAPNLLFKLNEL